MVGARLRVLREARDCVTKCAPLGKLVCSSVVAEVWQKTALHGGGLFVHPTTEYCTHACFQSFLVMSCMAFVFKICMKLDVTARSSVLLCFDFSFAFLRLERYFQMFFPFFFLWLCLKRQLFPF